MSDLGSSVSTGAIDSNSESTADNSQQPQQQQSPPQQYTSVSTWSSTIAQQQSADSAAVVRRRSPVSASNSAAAAAAMNARQTAIPSAPGGVAGHVGATPGNSEKWWLTSTASGDANSLNTLSEVQVLDSHLDIVRQLVSIDSTRIASGSDDGSIIVWQCALGQLLHRFEGHSHGVTVLLLLSDGETLASGAADRTVRLWSVRTYQHLRTLSVHTASVTCLERLTGGAVPRFVSGGNDRKLYVWQNDGTALGVIERQEEENLHCLLYVGNEQLISGSNSSLLLVYHTTSFDFQKILASTYHRESVRCLVKLSNDRFASASLDGAIVLWHATSLTPMRRLHYPERYVDAQNKLICDVAHLLAVDDGRYLAAAIGNGYVVYDVLSGECTVSCPDAHDAQVTHLASLYGGARVLSCSVDGTVKLWAPPSVLSSSSSATSTFFRFTSRLTNSSGAAAAARKAMGGVAKPRLVEPPLRGHCSSVWLALPLDATSVATCSSDGVILLWRDATRESARRAVVASQALAQLDNHDDALLASPQSAVDSIRVAESGVSPSASPATAAATAVTSISEIRVTPPEYLVAFARSRLRKDMVGVDDVVAQLRAEGHAEPLVASIADILRNDPPESVN